MAPLYFLADVFIKTFGITEPTEAMRRRAAFFILALLVLLLLGVLVAFVVLRTLIR